MTLLRILFVEDEPRHIERTRAVLAATRLFDLPQTILSYDDLNQSTCDGADLFVLDVMVGDSGESFAAFIRRLREGHRKPFIAFTNNSDTRTMPSFAGSQSLRQVVLEHGGMCVMMKRRSHSEGSTIGTGDIQLDLAETILKFYWSSFGQRGT